MSSALLLLSGGRSSRMGQDKAHLTIADMPLLEWQRQRFVASGFDVVAELPDRFEGFCGPLAGIDAALHSRPDIQEWLIVPVDMPEVSADCLFRLQQEGASAGRPACYQGCPLPLYLPVSEGLRQTLYRWLSDEDGKRSVYALMQEMNGHWLNVADVESTLFNINTPDQWQHYLKGAAEL